jgi:hypothetical protein
LRSFDPIRNGDCGMPSYRLQHRVDAVFLDPRACVFLALVAQLLDLRQAGRQRHRVPRFAQALHVAFQRLAGGAGALDLGNGFLILLFGRLWRLSGRRRGNRRCGGQSCDCDGREPTL